MGQCKLCLQEKQLIKKSHIIPDFMYKDLFDDKHAILLNTSNTKTRNTKILFNGEYEGNILCESCDGKIIGGIYENYASKA
jgi:hypothetical protein